MLITQQGFKNRAIQKIKDVQKAINHDFYIAKAQLEKERRFDDLTSLYNIYSESMYSLTNALNRVERNN